MNHARRGLRALALSLMAVLGSASLMAANAQALTWDVNGAEIAATKSFAGNLVPGTEHLILVPNLSLTIHCNTLTVEDGLLFVNNTAHATFKYTGCTALIKEKKSTVCFPSVPIIEKVKIKPILHNGEIYLLFEPLTVGQPLTVIEFEGEECPLPEENVVNLSYVLECYKGALLLDDCKVPKVRHTIKFAPPALFPTDKLTFGPNGLGLHGEIELFLTGADLNRNWNALE